jgi:hypothetical protein
MTFVTVNGQTYNLRHLVKYVSHVGQREVGVTESVVEPQPIFGEFRYIELFFSDGTSIALDGIQTDAFLNCLAGWSKTLDLDRIEEAALGHVVVHDTDEGGDIILPEDES